MDLGVRVRLVRLANPLPSPFEHFFRLQHELGRLFEGGARLDASRAVAWTPAVDVHEDAERLVFQLDVPNVPRESLRVNVERGVLTVEGDRKLEFEDKKSGYHRVERPHGKFARNFVLPDTVSADAVDAALRDGVLRVTLTKKADTKSKPISVVVS